MSEHEPQHQKQREKEISLKTTMIVGAALLGIATYGLKEATDWAKNIFDIRGHIEDVAEYIPPVIEHNEAAYYTAPVTLVDIEPIDMHCVGITTLEFSTEGIKEHKLFGRVFRTDTSRISASGDVVTCLDGSPLIINTPDSSTVMVDLADVTFLSPRIEFLNTETGELAELDFDKGWVGDVTDALPGVSDDETLTERTIAYAQNRFVTSECMETSEVFTKQLIEIAYTSQAAMKEVDDITVEFYGEVDYSQLETDPAVYQGDGYSFDVVEGSTSCEIAESADDQLEAVAPTTPTSSSLAAATQASIETSMKISELFG